MKRMIELPASTTVLLPSRVWMSPRPSRRAVQPLAAAANSHCRQAASPQVA